MSLSSMHILLKRRTYSNCGRVGRKQGAPTGKVIFMHEGVSIAMIQAKREIKMNRLGIERGWVIG